MAVIAKPTSDAGRLSLIKTSINTANSDAAAGKSYLSSETLERAKAVASDLETKRQPFQRSEGEKRSDAHPRNLYP